MSELPKGWVETTLGEIAPLTYGKALVGESRDPTGKVLVFGSSGRIGVHSQALTDRETIIVGRKGNVGAVFHCADPCWVIDTAYFINTPRWLDWRFLFYLLMNEGLGRLDRSTAIPGLSRDDYNKVRAFVAPLAEQRRIADEIETQFTRLDAATAALKRVQANLKRYRASFLKAACEGRLVPTEAELAPKEGRDYEPAEKLLQRILGERRARWEGDTLAKMLASGKPPRDTSWKHKYKEPAAPDTTNLPPLPEGWCWTSLDQLSWSSDYGTSDKCDYDGAGPVVLRIPNLQSGSINLIDSKRSVKAVQTVTGEELREGDLLIIRTNGSRNLIGRSALVERNFETTHLHASYLIRFRTVLVGAWIRDVWDAPSNRDSIERFAATSAGQYNVSMTELASLTIPLPPLNEIQRIRTQFDRLRDSLTRTEEGVVSNSSRALSFRRAILSSAFTGQLVPQDPTDEPASALLARIRAERSASSKPSPARRTRKEPTNA